MLTWADICCSLGKDIGPRCVDRLGQNKDSRYFFGSLHSDHRCPSSRSSFSIIQKYFTMFISSVMTLTLYTHSTHTRARTHTHIHTHTPYKHTHTHTHTHTALDHISRKGGSLQFRNGDDVKGSWRIYFECEYWCVVSIYILSHFLTPSLPLFLFLCFSFSLSLSVWMRILMQNLNFKYAFARQYMKWAHQLKKKMSSEWNMRQIWKCKVPVNYKWYI